MNVKIGNTELPFKILNEIVKYCELNNIGYTEEFIVKIIKRGFDLEKWGNVLKTVTSSTNMEANPQKVENQINTSPVNELKIEEIKQSTDGASIPLETALNYFKTKGNIYDE